MKTLLLFTLCFSLSAIEPETFLKQVEAAKIAREPEARVARVTLMTDLKAEESKAQAAGKLDLVLTIRTRIAELEAMANANPFESKSGDVTSSPVDGSAAEKKYADRMNAINLSAVKKVEVIFSGLEQKKIAATKAGKIDDALAYEGVMVEVKSQLDEMKKAVKVEQPKETEPLGVKIGGATCFDLTDMKLVSVRVGYAELGVNKSADGVHLPRPKSGAPKKYLMACAPASLVYKIPSGVQKFETTALRADDTNGGLKMLVKIDGKIVYETKEMTKQADAEKIMIDVPEGAQQIELVADPLGAITNDYATWCDPKFWRK